MYAIVIRLAFVASAFAYSILVPNTSQGWTSKGIQPLEWQRNSTDAQTFSVYLVNQQQAASFSPQLLEQDVDGLALKFGCNPPQGGWPIGSGFQVNLVPSDASPNSDILAQSDVFDITVAPTPTQTSTQTTIQTVSVTTSSQTTIAPTKNSAIQNVPNYSLELSGLLFLLYSVLP